MIKEFESEKYGNIVYEESLWTGRRRFVVGGVTLTKQTKESYVGIVNQEEVRATVYGNFLKGSSIYVGGETYVVSLPPKWYEYVIGFIPFVLILIWGNVPALCEIVPVIGGAIGGAISGVTSFFSVIFMKKTENILFKLLIGVGMIVGTFLLCMVLAFAFLSALV